LSDAATAEEYRVGPVADIPDREGQLVTAGDTEVGVFKVDDKLYAYVNRCMHQGGPVCSGVFVGTTRLDLNEIGEVLLERLDESEMRLVCPWHGWEYDISTGEAVHDSRLRLRRVEFDVRDGILFVTT
jgi:nitrite reductase/ring-hydroxylating ferredoxin subunit